MAGLIDDKCLDALRAVTRVEPLPHGVLLGVDDEQLRIEAVRADVVRLKLSQGGEFDETPTFAVSADLSEAPAVRVEETEDTVRLSTDAMAVIVSKHPFAVDAYRADGSVIFETWRDKDGTPSYYSYINNRFVVARRCHPHDAIYGLGEKTRGFNRRGHDFTLWNTDILSPDVDKGIRDTRSDTPEENPTSTVFDPYYVSIPFFYHLDASAPGAPMAGFFVDNGYESHFEFSDKERYRFECLGGQYTEYVFAGPSMKEILSAYTWLTGRMAPPPLWALGYHQCRWKKYEDKTLRELAAAFRRKDIPCDVLWLDIDYMHGYRVFTWNRGIFPDPAATLAALEKDKFRVITIIDPGVKAEEGYEAYDEARRDNLLCKCDNGQIYIGQVWPGRTAFPDFVKPEARAWWGRKNAEHVKSGLAGIWNDMNEPATGIVPADAMRFDRDGADWPHERYHNQYGLLMAMGTVEGLLAAMPERRTFVLSRAGFAGIQRYAANWMGDNFSRWDHLAMSVPMAMGLGVSGQPFVGADVGGFAEGSCAELLIRWTQAGALAPFFRNHNCNVVDQYPWSFGDAVEDLVRRAIRLRYRLLPYVYAAFFQAAETGEPIQRPLLFDFPGDRTARDIDDQYLLGESLLVAPVTEPGATHRRVYLPAGSWIDWNTGERHEGGQFVDAPAPLSHIPLFARGGSVVPLWPDAPASTMDHKPEVIELHVFLPAEEGEWRSVLREDDGLTFAYRDGAFLQTDIAFRREAGVTTLRGRVSGKGFPEFARKILRLVFHGEEVQAARLDGEETRIWDNAVDLDNAGTDFLVELA